MLQSIDKCFFGTFFTKESTNYYATRTRACYIWVVLLRNTTNTAVAYGGTRVILGIAPAGAALKHKNGPLLGNSSHKWIRFLKTNKSWPYVQYYWEHQYYRPLLLDKYGPEGPSCVCMWCLLYWNIILEQRPAGPSVLVFRSTISGLNSSTMGPQSGPLVVAFRSNNGGLNCDV